MGKKIYDDNWWYYRLKFLADIYIRGAFSRFKCIGLERIPVDGSVIYAPNHCNALMDPLAVINLGTEKMVFVARADIFKGKKAGKFLNFLKMMPINRRRDGIRNMTKAEDTIRKSIEVVGHKVKFCILPEGTHRTMHALLPIGKGVARVAYGAVKEVGASFPIYIVPVGLEYGDYYRFRSTLLVNIGEPINVTDLVFSHPEMSENDILQKIRMIVSERLHENIVCVSDEANYEAIWELSKIASGRHTGAFDLKARFETNRNAIEKIESFARDNQAEAKALFDETLEFTAARKKARISINTLNKRHPVGSAILNMVLSVVLLPFFIVFAAASLPVWTVSELAASRMEDAAFHNSLRLLTHLVVWTVLLAIWAVVLLCTVKWYWAIVAVVVLAPAPKLVYDYFELIRMTASDWRAMFNRDICNKYKSLENKLKSILNK